MDLALPSRSREGIDSVRCWFVGAVFYTTARNQDTTKTISALMMTFNTVNHHSTMTGSITKKTTVRGKGAHILQIQYSLLVAQA
jgi:hypothetical protein